MTRCRDAAHKANPSRLQWPSLAQSISWLSWSLLLACGWYTVVSQTCST